ncbi:methyl-accepting chemotaxis protein [Fusibacter ferrireducens]|uniref:Methyl-accepting chemotaxis protein n=1 Tax=Fusibacter ferrireducens TaxID=2785058 RepID=A0ABS0A0E7_9FIRM|nr:methyl-accepting chemotaxis protein [Fusibacter ferrireducens]MBF4695625.1 methyl-accepting chemotaxis protein [Fusibacter ferrireducens]
MEKKGRTKRSKSRRSIKAKFLLIMSLILIIGVATLNYSVYLISKNVLTDNFEETARELSKSTELIIEGFLSEYEGIVAAAIKTEEFSDYDGSPESTQRLKNYLDLVVEEYPNILFMYLGTENGDMIMRPNGNLKPDYDPRMRPWYSDALNTDEIVWTQPYIDSTTKDLVVTCTAKVKDKNNKLMGVIGLDLKLEQLSELVNSITIGKTGYPALVDGNLLMMTSPDLTLIGKEIPVPEINEALKANSSEVIKYIYEADDKKIKKLALIEPLEKVNWYIIATFSESEIVEDIAAITWTIILYGLAILVISLIIIFISTTQIGNNIKKIVGVMERAQNGDLTAVATIHSNDEINHLADYMASAFESIGMMIKNVQGVTQEVSYAAENLAATSEETSASVDEISKSVSDISKGAQEQAADAEKGATYVNELAKKFEELNSNTSDMLSASAKVLDANEKGLSSIQLLREKTKLNDDANLKISEAIHALNDKTQSIGNILNTISSISEQTNLLALNASIEAARAGEFGRGFAVVAEEIRKLAEESAKSTEEIREIIVNIQSDSNKTVTSMTEVQTISKEQSQAVYDVNDQFDEISDAINEINTGIKRISVSVDQLNHDKNNIVESIEGISAVSEETAAASQQMDATMDQQVFAIEEVAKSAEKLNELASILNQEISKFKI